MGRIGINLSQRLAADTTIIQNIWRSILITHAYTVTHKAPAIRRGPCTSGLCELTEISPDDADEGERDGPHQHHPGSQRPGHAAAQQFETRTEQW